jgi:hypothetical protein
MPPREAIGRPADALLRPGADADAGWLSGRADRGVGCRPGQDHHASRRPVGRRRHGVPGRGRGEVDAGAPHLQDIVRHAGLDLERTRAAVQRLLHTEPKILHEVPDPSRTDLGPVYELAPRI